VTDNMQDGVMPTADAGAAGGTPSETQKDGAPEILTFESWLGSQDETVKGLIDGHIKGLKSALESERAQRSDLARQLRDVTAKAEKGSELEKALMEVSTQLEAAERRAAFYEEAGRPEIGCLNPKAAFALAQAEDLFDKRGRVDWEALKANAPELFRPRVPQGNAGLGTSGPPPAHKSMNDFIRRAAGR
jgi:hypothetical protein